MLKPEIIKNRNIQICLLAFLLIFLICLFFPVHFKTALYLEMKADHLDQLQVYYDLGEGFIEDDSISEMTAPVAKERLDDSDYYAYYIPIPAERVTAIRLDPFMQEGTFAIRQILLESRFYREAIDLDTLPANLTGSSEINILNTDYPGFRGESLGDDPNIIIYDSKLNNSIPLYSRIITALVLCLIFYFGRQHNTLIVQKIAANKRKLPYYLLAFPVIIAIFMIWPRHVQTTLNVEVKADQPGQFQVYYDTGDGFVEEDSFNELADYIKKERIGGTGYYRYQITLPAKEITAIRLDPLMQEGAFSVRHIELSNLFYQEIVKLNELTEQIMQPKEITFTDHDTYGIQGYSLGNDPNFIFYQAPVNNAIPYYAHIIAVLLLLAVAFLAFKYYSCVADKIVKDRKLLYFALGTIAIFSVCIFLFKYVPTLLYIEIEAEHPEELQVFYESDDVFKQDDSIDETEDPIVKSRLYGDSYWIYDERYYEYYLTLPARPIGAIRIDPMMEEGPFSIRHITLQNMFFSKIFDLDVLSDQVTGVHEIDLNVNSPGKFAGLSTGTDPHFTLHEQELNNIIPLYLRLLIALLLSLIWYYFLQSYKSIGLKFAGYYAMLIKTPVNFIMFFMLFFIIILILAMAVTSGFDGHPDEYLNFKAAEYFRTNWIRPEVGHEDLISHYRAVWGLSRLHYSTSSFDYFLMGKVSLYILDFIVDNIVISARLFNVLLFAVFLLLLRSKYRISLIVMLIIPQVWYIFSYINATDSYALLLSMLTVFVLLDEKNLLNNFFNNRSPDPDISQTGSTQPESENTRGEINRQVFFLGTLLALIASSKSNYLAFVAFAVIYLLITYFDRSRLLQYAKKMGMILLIMAAWLLLFFAYDLAIHGFDKNEQIEEAREEYSWYYVKPSVEESFQEQGIGFTELITDHNWHTYTYRSFVGYYAYMSKYTGDQFYIYFGALFSLLILYMVSVIYIKGNWRDRLLLTAGLGLILALIFISYYMSWTFRFQPQGRYLFPSLAILATYFGRYQHLLNKKVIFVLTLILFGMALYSFIFTGLYETPGWYIIDRS